MPTTNKNASGRTPLSRLGKLRAIAILGCAIIPFGAVSAQESEMPDQQVELVSEMWAMAGICSQYPAYSVRNEQLADWLNEQMAGNASAADIAVRRAAKIAQITARMEALNQLSGGSSRQRQQDENSADIMSRCRRLASDPVAATFFAVTRR